MEPKLEQEEEEIFSQIKLSIKKSTQIIEEKESEIFSRAKQIKDELDQLQPFIQQSEKLDESLKQEIDNTSAIKEEIVKTNKAQEDRYNTQRKTQEQNIEKLIEIIKQKTIQLEKEKKEIKNIQEIVDVYTKILKTKIICKQKGHLLLVNQCIKNGETTGRPIRLDLSLSQAEIQKQFWEHIIAGYFQSD